MASFGKGIAAFGTPTVDCTAALHDISTHRPDDWAFCKFSTGAKRGWYGVKVEILKQGLKSAAQSGQREVNLCSLVREENVSPVVSAVIADAVKKSGLGSTPGTKFKLRIDLRDEAGIRLVMPPEHTIKLIDDLSLNLDDEDRVVHWFTGKPHGLKSPGGGARAFGKQPYIHIIPDLSGSAKIGLGKPPVGAGKIGRIISNYRKPAAPSDADFSGLAQPPPAGPPPGDDGPGLSAASSGGAPASEPTAAAKPDEITVFPDIRATPRHVVARQKLRVEVALDFKAVDDVEGIVILPPGKHRIDVHALVDTEDGWGELVFDTEKGTVKRACIDLTAPRIPDQAGAIPDRWVYPVVVNFYLANRWCGEGRYHIEVLARRGVEPTPDLPAVKEGPWTSVLRIVPGGVPPDLLVRIQTVGQEQYKFTLVSPHLNFRPTGQDVAAIAGDGYRYVKANLNQIASAVLNDDQIVEIKSKLRAIYDSAPRDFKTGYWTLWRKAHAIAPAPNKKKAKLETIQFVSDEPYIPWDLMLTRPEKSEEPEEILSVAHAVGRWTTLNYFPLRCRIPVQKMAVFACDYEGTSAPALPGAAEEQKLLSAPPYRAQANALTKEAVKKFFATGGAQAVHFSCHGTMDVQQPGDAALWLADCRDFTTAFVDQPIVRNGLGKDRPLVFLNACQVGGQGKVVAIVTGWPQAFLNIGATACVAPLWNVVDANAKSVSAQFYRLVFQNHVSLGAALQQIKSQWESARSLTYLSYTLYGDPAATVTWAPRSVES